MSKCSSVGREARHRSWPDPRFMRSRRPWSSTADRIPIWIGSIWPFETAHLNRRVWASVSTRMMWILFFSRDHRKFAQKSNQTLPSERLSFSPVKICLQAKPFKSRKKILFVLLEESFEEHFWKISAVRGSAIDPNRFSQRLQIFTIRAGGKKSLLVAWRGRGTTVRPIEIFLRFTSITGHRWVRRLQAELAMVAGQTSIGT